MKLATLHQILIVSMIALCGVFALRCVWLFRVQGDMTQLGLMAVSLLVGLAAVAYLRVFRAKRALAGPTGPTGAGLEESA